LGSFKLSFLAVLGTVAGIKRVSSAFSIALFHLMIPRVVYPVFRLAFDRVLTQLKLDLSESYFSLVALDIQVCASTIEFTRPEASLIPICRRIRSFASTWCASACRELGQLKFDRSYPTSSPTCVGGPSGV
jgi:hypothetical protein